MIKSVTAQTCYFIRTNETPWNLWQTNAEGTSWCLLMGESWEGLEPEPELVQEFLSYMQR